MVEISITTNKPGISQVITHTVDDAKTRWGYSSDTGCFWVRWGNSKYLYPTSNIIGIEIKDVTPVE